MEKNDSLPVAVPPHEFNPIFSKLVGVDEDDELLGVVAYGLYKKAKSEWAASIAQQYHRPPTSEELKAYMATWTPSQLVNAKRNAAQVLSAYADSVISAEEPRILKDALKGSFWTAVSTGIVGSFLYTLILIAVALVLARSGIDLIGIFSAAAGK
ncbi:MAG: hypothetical protein EOS75_03810 [Mesorhizobium sp.]|nr:MAG: hypothetical protein EOS74_08255 [Mesorhizobium sp.]RWD58845.1 MAG: hypothetical protein EOS75_03810 [Mesorhizobium sp.]